MIIISDFLMAGLELPPVTTGSVDPLRQDDVLQESQVLDIRSMAVANTAAVLLDQRSALWWDQGNTAVIRARGVRRLDWAAIARDGDWSAWNVMGSSVRPEGNVLTLRLMLHPDAVLAISAQGFDLCIGDVADLPAAPPDYVEDPVPVVRAGLASWESVLKPSVIARRYVH